MTVTGHKTQRALLEKLLNTDKLPHALLFAGQAGIGKRQAAYELARKIYSKAKISLPLSSNPDFKEIDCQDRAAVNAENIRELLYSLNLNSFLSSRRIIILNNVEYIPVQSANILLKSLEEPNKDTHFILISSNPYKMPSTLLSRCQIVNFNPLSVSEINSILASGTEFTDWMKVIESKNIKLSELATLSQGSFENISAIINDFDNWLIIKDELSKIVAGDTSVAVSLTEKLSKDKDHLRANVRILSTLLRNQMYSSPSNSAYEQLATALTLLTIAERLIFERNLSASHVLNFILCNLAKRDMPISIGSPDENISFLVNL